MTRLRIAAALLVCVMACVLAKPAIAADTANPQVLYLWQEGAPGATSTDADTVRVTEQGERVVSNVHRPSLTVYLPKDKGSGVAVIIAPGGGHRELWTDHEGHNVAKFLNEKGIAAFVLKYRLARAPNSTYTIEGDALNDLQRSVRLVRSRAAEWSMDPAKIGVMGFSAGGQLVLLNTMRFDAGNAAAKDAIDRQSSRPDFAALIYPGAWPEIKFDANTPPMYLLSGSDDRPQVLSGLTQIFLALREAKVPAELHFYDGVPHGFGLRASNTGPVSHWPEQFVDWLKIRKLL